MYIKIWIPLRNRKEKIMKKIIKFWELAKGNLGAFVLSLVLMGVIIGVAIVSEMILKKKGIKDKVSSTKKITIIGMFSALAAVLMYVEFPLWFAPADIYKLDFSEIPVLICSFIFGPISGIICELVKILIKLIIKPTSTAFVGEFANFLIGCSFVVPASAIYHFKKSRKNAMLGMTVGTIVLAGIGSLLNALFLLPVFSVFYGINLDIIVGMGTALNASVNNVFTFAALIVLPFNLIKGVLVSIAVFFVYKPISSILKVKL